MREDGYYWVTCDQWEKPGIAEWYCGAWWRGLEILDPVEYNITPIGGRLEPPKL